MTVFDRRYELMPRPELEQLQLERLQSLLVRLRRNVRRYREQLTGVHIESLNDLDRLPMTSPEDLADSFPYGLFALPLREVIRLHSTIGPKGAPLVLGHTHNDLTQWGRLAARQLTASGVTANDVIQISLGSGIYRGASGYVLGAELIGASVIAEEPYHIDMQMAMLRNYRPTMLVTTPSNAQELIRLMDQERMDPQSLNLRTVLLSRPIDDEMREQLRAGLQVVVQSNFGVAEMLDPGLCVECSEGKFHANEDHFLVESKDGELVVTTLTREAAPLLRYRTRITCSVRRERCACGRTGAVLTPTGRLDGRLRVNENPLYENQISQLLNQTAAAGLPFWIHVTERTLIILIQMTSAIFSDATWPIMYLKREIETEFLSRLGISAEVHFVERTPDADAWFAGLPGDADRYRK